MPGFFLRSTIRKYKIIYIVAVGGTYLCVPLPVFADWLDDLHLPSIPELSLLSVAEREEELELEPSLFADLGDPSLPSFEFPLGDFRLDGQGIPDLSPTSPRVQVVLEQVAAGVPVDGEAPPLVLSEVPPSDALPAPVNSRHAQQVQFGSQIVDSIRNFERERERLTLPRDFRATYVHQVRDSRLGMAYLVEIERNTASSGAGAIGYRQRAGVGLQIPLLGTRSLVLRRAHGQLLTRIVPIGLHSEKLYLADQRGQWVRSPYNGFVPSASVGLEANVRIASRFQPGARFVFVGMVQDGAVRYRTIAEVYVKIRLLRSRVSWIQDRVIRTLSIVPRCIHQSTNYPNSVDAFDPESIAPGVLDIIGTRVDCLIGVEFLTGQ